MSLRGELEIGSCRRLLADFDVPAINTSTSTQRNWHIFASQCQYQLSLELDLVSKLSRYQCSHKSMQLSEIRIWHVDPKLQIDHASRREGDLGLSA